jgi:pilus assembly protein CpaE
MEWAVQGACQEKVEVVHRLFHNRAHVLRSEARRKLVSGRVPVAGKISLVVIDSSGDSAAAIERILNSHNSGLHMVGTASSFEKGYELIFAKRPAVVIMEAGDDDISVSLGRVKTILSRLPRTFIFVTGEHKTSEAMLALLRAGASEFLPKPVTEADLMSAVGKLFRSGAAAVTAQRKGEIYAVFSPKGGAGVTTVAINLAANILERTGRSTVIVDLDHTAADIAPFLDLKPSYTVRDALAGINELDKRSLQNIIIRHSSGVHVLAQPIHVGEEVPERGGDIKKLLDILSATFRYVVVDTGPHVSEATISAMQMSDTVLMLFVMSLPSIKNTRKYLDYLYGRDIRGEKVKAVVNRYHKKGNITLADAESVLQLQVFGCIPNDYVTAIDSLNRGMPVSSFAPRSALNGAIRDLAAKMTGTGGNTQAAENAAGASHRGNIFRNLARRLRET